jgi:predicted ABC-type ATPase
MIMTADPPVCYIIAGPNGAGKTTFALRYLPEVARCQNFVNADMIAAGLSPLSPERERIAAARLFLGEIDRFVGKRESFGFETTLSGTTYLRLIDTLRKSGWRVVLIYLFLPSVEWAIQRVQERVEHGGHAIAEGDIRRRFPRSLKNLLNRYAPVCDETICLNNQSVQPALIFVRDSDGLQVFDEQLYQNLIEEAKR